MSIVRNALYLLGSSAVDVPTGLVTGILLARWLTTDDRGYYGVVVAFVALMALTHLGWPAAAIFRMRRLRIPPARVASAALVGWLGLSALAIGACLLAEPWIRGTLLEGAPRSLYPLALIAIPAQLAGVIFTGIARGIDRFDLQVTYRVAVSLGRLGAIALALVVFEGALFGAFAALVLVQVLAAAGLLVAVLRLTGVEAWPRREELVSTPRFGAKAWVQAFAGRVHENADVFMLVALLRDPSQVAYYTVATGILGRLRIVPETMSVALYPELAAASPERSAALVAAALRHSVVFVGLGMVGLAVVGPVALPMIWGAPYAASVRPFLVLLPGIALLTVYRLLARYFIATDRQSVNLTALLVSIPVNLALNFVLIPRFGTVGAALASLSSYGLEAIIITVVFVRTSGHGMRDCFLLRASDLHVYRRRLEPLLRRWSRRRNV